jgi:hypothetical protein
MYCVKTEDPRGKWGCKLHHPLILNKNDSLIGANHSPIGSRGSEIPNQENTVIFSIKVFPREQKYL